MNLHFLVLKKWEGLEITGSVDPAAKMVGGEKWSGIEIGPDSSVRIKDIMQYYSFLGWPEDTGWYALCSPNGRQKNPHDFDDLPLVITLDDSNSYELLNKIEIECDLIPKPIPIPWSVYHEGVLGKMDICIHNKSLTHSKYLMCYKRESREQLIALAKGKGIEIGPGSNPQIKSSNNVDVQYLEQKKLEEWSDLYDKNNNRGATSENFSKYIIGEAHQLDVHDNSLNFVFSSHVFEHLSNPLGHLQVWLKKLIPGGLILSIIPEIRGTKDNIKKPSLAEQWIDEYENNVWLPTINHYKYYYGETISPSDIEKKYEAKESIHIYFYTPKTIGTLYEIAQKRFGFSDFRIKYNRNAKDFFAIIKK